MRRSNVHRRMSIYWSEERRISTSIYISAPFKRLTLSANKNRKPTIRVLDCSCGGGRLLPVRRHPHGREDELRRCAQQIRRHDLRRTIGSQLRAGSISKFLARAVHLRRSCILGRSETAGSDAPRELEQLFVRE